MYIYIRICYTQCNLINLDMFLQTLLWVQVDLTSRFKTSLRWKVDFLALVLGTQCLIVAICIYLRYIVIDDVSKFVSKVCDQIFPKSNILTTGNPNSVHMK